MNIYNKIYSVLLFFFFMNTTNLIAINQIINISQIVQDNSKAVVMIYTVKQKEGSITLGSGFIVDSKGIIITNFHVIEGSYPVVIKISNGDIYDDVSIIDFDERRDLVILKIMGFNLPTVNLGDSNSIKVGDQIIVIGNPEGLENTVTDGIISAFRETGEGYKLFQISAPISPGSSGSPVFNLKGEVIGVASSSLVKGQNLNFSVPINYARGLISDKTKMSLEDFAKIHIGPSSPGKAKQKESDLAKVLLKLNEVVIKTYQAYDNYSYGIYETIEPHTVAFIANKFSISTSLFYAKEKIQLALEEIDGLNFKYDIPSDLYSRYRKLITEVMTGIDTTIDGLKKYSSYGYPDWESVKQGSAKIHTVFSDIGNPANRDLLKYFRQHIPEVLNQILPVVIMSEWSTNYPVQLGLIWAYARNDVFITGIYKDGLAYKAGLKPGDIILKEQNSKPFSSVIDFHYFLMRQKRGNKIKLIFDRTGKKYYANIIF